MRTAIVVAMLVSGSSVFADEKSTHAKLLKLYDEPDTWKNNANFYVGVRGGVGVPAGAYNLAPNVGVEVGVAPDFGFGLGLHVLWMNHPPGAPAFGITEGKYGFGTMLDVRFNIPTVEPLTLYPTVGLGFLAGPGIDGKNMVLPLVNPGLGAKMRFADFYGEFEFGFAGLSIPYVTVGFGYQGDRRKQRAEAWAREEEEAAREKGVPVDLTPRHKEAVAPPVVPHEAPVPEPVAVAVVAPKPEESKEASGERAPLKKPASDALVLNARLEWAWSRGVVLHNLGKFDVHGCEVRLPNGRYGRFDPGDQIDAGGSDNIRASNLSDDPRDLDSYMKQGYALVRCKEAQAYVWWGTKPG